MKICIIDDHNILRDLIEKKLKEIDDSIEIEYTEQGEQKIMMKPVDLYPINFVRNHDRIFDLRDIKDAPMPGDIPKFGKKFLESNKGRVKRIKNKRKKR